jgi:tRNA 5-methylaminomethyl-2-thiouridine biosynthesis bifunctional protein
VLANARDASRLLPGRFMEQRCVLGQLTTLDAGNLARLGAWPDCVVTGGGYLLPVAADGAARVGSSYEDACGPLLLRASVHEANLGKLAAMLPALAGPLAGIDPAGLGGYVGVRSVSHNRLPLIGQMADELAATVAAAKLRGAHLRDLPRLPGLYASLAFASRGLTWAALGAEVLASMIEGEPLPVESDLADALDPARLLLRALRHGKAHDAAAQQA